jgi:hypothetical protein
MNKIKGQASVEIVIGFSIVTMITILILFKWLSGTEEINQTVGARLATIKLNDLNFDSNKFMLKGFEKEIIKCTTPSGTEKIKIMATIYPNPNGTNFENEIANEIKNKINLITGKPQNEIDIYLNDPIKAHQDKEAGCI